MLSGRTRLGLPEVALDGSFFSVLRRSWANRKQTKAQSKSLCALRLELGETYLLAALTGLELLVAGSAESFGTIETTS